MTVSIGPWHYIDCVITIRLISLLVSGHCWRNQWFDVSGWKHTFTSGYISTKPSLSHGCVWYKITSSMIDDFIHITVPLSQSWKCHFKVYYVEISPSLSWHFKPCGSGVTLKGVCADGLSGDCQVEASSLWCYLLGDGISLQIIAVIISAVIHRQSGDRDPHLIKTSSHQMHPLSI